MLKRPDPFTFYIVSQFNLIEEIQLPVHDCRIDCTYTLRSCVAYIFLKHFQGLNYMTYSTYMFCTTIMQML